MGQGESPDSNSSGSEFRRTVARSRSRRAKEARVSYSSRMSMSHQDPMPEYIDPELVKLIAENAPFELDVFVRSLHANTKDSVENSGMDTAAVKENDRRPLAVEALLSCVRERNHHLSASKGEKGFRHSCPEPISCDYNKEEDGICRAKMIKRKRHKGIDTFRISIAERQAPSEVSICRSDNIGISELLVASPERKVASAASSDQGSNCLEDDFLPPFKQNAFGLSSALPPPLAGNDGHTMDAKPWRLGMRKSMRSTKDDKPPESVRCKRKADVDSRKTSEVRKYMEAKELERRKEQVQLKAEADAALAARKEQQRKLDLHRQTLLLSQMAGGKSREHCPRPAWVSEYSGLGEPPRPWSSSSSGEFNIYLPPPVTPPNLEPVPLDLYTTRIQHAERQHPTSRVDGNQVHRMQPWEKHQYEQVEGCKREVQKQRRYRESGIRKAFPDGDLELTVLANPPVIRKARWKGKPKPKGRKLSAQEVSQLQLMEHNGASLLGRSRDLEVYKRSLRRQIYRDCGSLFKAAKASSRAQKSAKTFAKSMLWAESGVNIGLKDHVYLPSKVKRLKQPQHVIASEAKELTAKEIATLLNANRVPSDCESGAHITCKGTVIAERMVVKTRQSSPAIEQDMVTDHWKCVGHPLGSPQKNEMDGDILVKCFGPPLNGSQTVLMDENVPQKSRGVSLGSSLKPSRSKEVQQQVADFSKEKADSIHEVNRGNKDPVRTVQRQRMHLLKNLAEQLMNRVNAACAKKHQLACSAVDQCDNLSLESQLDIITEPVVQLDRSKSGHKAESLEPVLKCLHELKPNNGQPHICPASFLQENKSLELGLKFLQPRQHKIFPCGGLTELEQAGCRILPAQDDEMKATIKPSSTSFSRASMSEVNDRTAAVAPVSEICTMMDWNTTDKGMEITCNIPSACSSFGPSSPSTGSSSPVILPTSAKYHMGRIKHSKLMSNEEQTQQAKREEWALPVDKDMHSFINLYTQHWKLKEREKVTASAYQRNTEDRLLEKIENESAVVVITGQEKKSTCASVPLHQKLTIPQLKSFEANGVQGVQADCCCKHEQSPKSDSRVLDLQSKQNVSSSNCESLQNLGLEGDKSLVRQPTELNKFQMNSMEPTGKLGLNIPEVTLVEIGDLKLCRSPTSFHLRLDRCKDNWEDKEGGEQKLVTISHLPKMRDLTEESSSTCVDSKEDTGGQCVADMICPMKITYARRFRSRPMPNGGCTDDERVVVKLLQTNMGRPAAQMQRENRIVSPELDESEEAVTEDLSIPQLNKVVENAPSEIKSATKSSTAGKEVLMLARTKGNGGLMCATLKEGTKALSDVKDGPDMAAFGESTCKSNDENVKKRESGVKNLKDDDGEHLKGGVMGGKPLLKEMRHLETNDEDCGDVVHNSLMFGRPRGMKNGQCQTMRPLSNQGNLFAFEGEPEALQAKSSDGTAQETELASEFNHDLKLDPQIGLQDSQEWELKLRRNQLEAELQRLDVQIMKTRAKLQQSHCRIENQKHIVSISLSGDPQVESLLDLQQNAKSAGKQSATQRACRDAYQMRSDSQMQKTGPSPLNSKLCRDVENNSTSSNSYSDSFVSEDTELGQKIGGTWNSDSLAGYCLKRKNGKFCCLTVKEKPVNQQFEAIIMEDQSGSNEGDAANHISAAQAYCKMLSTKDEFASEGSGKSTGRAQGRRHGRPLRVNAGEIITCNQILDARSLGVIPDQTADLGVGVVLQCPEDNMKNPESSSTSVKCGSQGSVEDSADMTENSGRGPWMSLGKFPITIEENIASVNREQISFQQNRRILENCENSHKVPCLQYRAGESKDAQVLSSSLDGKLEDKNFCAAVLSTPHWSSVTSENSSGGVPFGTLGKKSQKKGEDIITKSKTLTCSRNSKTLRSVENSLFSVAPVVLPCPLDAMEETESCIAVVDSSLQCGQQTSGDIMENQTQISSQECCGLLKEGSGQMATSQGGKAFTWSHDRKIIEEASASVLQKFHDAVFTPVNLSDGSASKDEGRESLSLPSCKDFSKIKDNLKGNKLVTSRSATSNDVSPNSKNVHEPSSSLMFEQIKAHKPQGPKSKYLPVTKSCQENSLNSLSATISGPESGSGIIEQSNQFCHTKESTRAGCSLQEPPSFLPSVYFNPQRSDWNTSGDEKSIISEHLENDESDIAEDIQGDIEVHSSLDDFEATSQLPPNSPLSNNIFLSASSDVTICPGSGSPNRTVFRPESVLSTTNSLVSPIKHVPNDSSAACDKQGLIVGSLLVASAASDVGGSSLVLQRHTQHRHVALSCRSDGTGDPEVVRSVGLDITDGVNYLEIPRASDNNCGRFLVSGSHFLSGSTGEEVDSGASETFMASSGLSSRNVHITTTEVNARIESNDEGDLGKFVNSGEKYYCNSMVSDPPSKPDSIKNAGRSHSGARAELISITGHMEDIPDMSICPAKCVGTTSSEEDDLRERVRSGDNSLSEAEVSSSHIEYDGSNPVELPQSCAIPQLRGPSESSTKLVNIPFSSVLHSRNLHSEDIQSTDSVSKEEFHMETMSGPHLGSAAYTKNVDGSSSDVCAGSSSYPRTMMKISHTTFPFEQCDPGTCSLLDMENIEGNQIPMQETLDLEGNGGLPCLEIRLVQECDANWSVELAQQVGSESENSSAEKQEETGEISAENHKFPNFTAADPLKCSENVKNFYDPLDDNAIQLTAAVSSHTNFDYARCGLTEGSHQGEEVLVVPVPCASQTLPTFVGSNPSVSNYCLTDKSSGDQRPVESMIVKKGPNSLGDSLYNDELNRCLPTSSQSMVPVTRDILSLSDLEDGDQSKNISLRSDEIIALQPCNTNTSHRAPLLSHQQTVIDFHNDARYQVQTMISEVSLENECMKVDVKDKGHMDDVSTLTSQFVSSLQVGQIAKLLSQHDKLSEDPTNCCSDNEVIVLPPSDKVVGDSSIEVLEVTFAEDLEGLSSNLMCNSIEENINKRKYSLMSEHRKEESSCCEILEDLSSVGKKLTNSSRVLLEETLCTSKLTNSSRVLLEETLCTSSSGILGQGSCCPVTGSNNPGPLDGMKNVRLEVDANRLQRHKVMADILTDMLYEDLISVELSGFHYKGDKTPTSHNKSRQANQTVNAMKTWTPIIKSKSRKVSEFCAVLKHFLPTGWRSLSIKHKNVSFLHVDGLKQHSLSSATRLKHGPLKLSGHYPCESGQFLNPGPQPLLFDFTHVHSYVQRTFQLSSLIIDPSPSNWYDSKNPVGEHIFGAVESYFWKTRHGFEGHQGCQWQIDKKLLSDLVNESLLEQFSTKLLVPSPDIQKVPLPPSGDNLVQFITNRILEHERCALRHRFDIDKAVAKVFNDEDWERCFEEAQDMVSDLAQDILCDLIERFTYEMLLGKSADQFCSNQYRIVVS